MLEKKLLSRMTPLLCLVPLVTFCGVNDVTDNRSATSQSTPKSSKKRKTLTALDELPPIHLLHIPQPKSLDYQRLMLMAEGERVAPQFIMKEIKTLKEHIDVINAIFEETRTIINQIQISLVRGEIEAQKNESKRIYITDFNAETQRQYKLTVDGVIGSTLSWNLERKSRFDEYFTLLFGGRMETSNPDAQAGFFIFKSRHPDAPNITPLDINYTFSLLRVLPTAPYVDAPAVATNESVDGNATSSLLPSEESGFYEWNNLLDPSDQTFKLVTQQDATLADSHLVMVAQIYGQLYKAALGKGGVTTYKENAVKWDLNRNLTTKSGDLAFNKKTLALGQISRLLTPKKENSYLFRWRADGAGQVERFKVDITNIDSGAIGQTPSSTVCWDRTLKKESCKTTIQLAPIDANDANSN